MPPHNLLAWSQDGNKKQKYVYSENFGKMKTDSRQENRNIQSVTTLHFCTVAGPLCRRRNAEDEGDEDGGQRLCIACILLSTQPKGASACRPNFNACVKTMRNFTRLHLWCQISCTQTHAWRIHAHKHAHKHSHKHFLSSLLKKKKNNKKLRTLIRPVSSVPQWGNKLAP